MNGDKEKDLKPEDLSDRTLEFAEQANTSRKKKDYPVLPEEIINRICLCLRGDLKDIAKMKLCCKDWHQNTIKIFTADQPMWLSMTQDKMLFYRAKDRTVFAMKHKFTLPEILYCSSLGHLVTIVGKEHEIAVLNLTTLTATTLPSLASEFKDILQAISWQGGADQFATLAISSIPENRSIGISVYCQTTGWASRRGECEYHFQPSEQSAPLIVKNSAYIIGRHCHLGVYELDKFTWRLFPAKASWTMCSREECHLVSVEGSVLAVITDENHMCQPTVLKLNMERKGWDQIWSLNGFSLFSGSPTSFAIQDQSLRSLVTLPSVTSKYSLTDADMTYCAGHLLFVLDNCIPIQSSLQFTCWILDKDAVKSRFASSREKSKKSFNYKEMLGVGTWIHVKPLSQIEDLGKTLIGPIERLV